jgi:uncharacterized protein
MQVIQDNVCESQYDAYVDGAVAGSLHYRIEGDQMWLLHTAAGQDVHGVGLADALIRRALSDAYRGRLSVLPFCHEVRKRIFAHPVYLQLVPGADRERFRVSIEESTNAQVSLTAGTSLGMARVREAAAA